jgi:DNA-binding NtrC family response regulator
LLGDDLHMLQNIRLQFVDAGIVPVLALSDNRATLPFLEQHSVSLIVLDMSSGMGESILLSRICNEYPHIPVIVVTASPDVEIAVQCMKLGVFDYLVKPVDSVRLIKVAEKALDARRSQQESSSLKEYLLNDHLEHAEAFAEIKTVSRKMRSILQYSEIVAGSSQAVLITGETGAGKELFAKAIHRISGVRGQFICVNVAGLDDAMFSDTLFGHKKGAFTGADQCRDGLVSKADKGTLFLDEIGDLSELSQVKLLRLLQEKEYYPVGSDQVKSSTARIVMATNANLKERIKDGIFRRDLYYRLCSHHIHIPALRERREDIPLLLESFVKEGARHFGRSIPVVPHDVVQALSEYDFPGNVRELKARVSDAVARHNDGMLTLDDFSGIPVAAQQQSPVPVSEATAATTVIYSLFGRLPTFHEIEDYLIVEALKLSEGNYAAAAAILGVTRQTISKRLKSIGSVS